MNQSISPEAQMLATTSATCSQEAPRRPVVDRPPLNPQKLARLSHIQDRGILLGKCAGLESCLDLRLSKPERGLLVCHGMTSDRAVKGGRPVVCPGHVLGHATGTPNSGGKR